MAIVTRSGRAASQHPEELDALLELVRDERVGAYLEIGARHGDTFFDVVRAMPPGSKAVAVDLPGGKWGRASSRGHLKAAVRELKALGYEASVIFGDSRTAGVRRQAMARGPYDLALIDGDHTLEGVRSDWANYGGMARMVAFHDIVGEGQRDKSGNPVEVPALWQQLRDRRHVEFVGADSRMGIGVLWR